MPDSSWLIVLNRGEKIVENLAEFCRQENILSGSFNAIGAVNQVEMAHFDPVKKHYSYKMMNGALEIVSLNGNISRLEGKSVPEADPFRRGRPASGGGDIVVHSHIAVSAEDMLCYGGHLKEATVAVICEIALIDYKTKVIRAFDKEIGLNLIQ